MKISSSCTAIPRVLLAIAIIGSAVGGLSCGRSNSGWVGPGGSIFAGDPPPKPAETESEEATPVRGLTLEEQLAASEAEDDELAPPGGVESPSERGVAERGLRRPGGPIRERVRPDSLAPATTTGGVADADSSLRSMVALADSLRESGLDVPDSLQARIDSLASATEAIPDWASGAGTDVVSSWTPDQLPEEAFYETPEDRLPSSGLRVFGQVEEIDPAQDALLYRMADALLSRSAARRSPYLSAEQATALDTLEFRPRVPSGPTLKAQDFVARQTSVDFEARRLRLESLYDGRTSVRPPLFLSMDEYTRRLTGQSVHRLWTEVFREDLKRTDRQNGTDRLITLDIPVELPGGLQGIFGKGKPNLSVSGSESISFKGTSRWFPNQKQSDTGRKQSKFPQLNMEQRLNLRLTGTIGDKVTVDVEQSSESDTPLANRIRIRYTGYEDEIVQRVELGNTSLRLPGTRYVSFSGQAEGLFGINALAKVGDVDFNIILSKQEGQSDEKSLRLSAETQTVRINDYDYVAGKYFFLRDPDGCPWKFSEVQVYLDDQIGGNNAEDGAIPAIATLDGEPAEGDEPEHRGDFTKLEPFEDYIVETEFYTGHPYLVLNRPIRDAKSVLAVRVSGNELEGPNLEVGAAFSIGTPLGQQGGTTLFLAVIRPERTNPTDLTAGPWGPLSKLEMKNVYDLGANNILPEGFDMKIRRKQISGQDNEPDRLPDGTTFLEVTGIDRGTLTSTGPIPGPDDLVDSRVINFQEGLLLFPDLRPFDPSSSDLCLSAECGFCRVNPDGNDRYGPRSLAWAELDSTQYRAPIIYTRDREVIANPEEFSRYYLEVTYRSPVSSIRLPAFNILEGSEVVTASGRRLTRDRDYRIDYNLGEIDILPAAGVTETEDISVTYSHVPFGGGGGQKTLAGVSAFIRPEEAKWNVSSTWLFESKGGVPGLEGKRPRLGEEPSRTLVGEFAGQYLTDSWWLTDVTDKLPFLDAREASRFELEAGLGMSFPNPNTRNQLYIDDFEGAKDVTSLSLNRRSWIPPSVPVRIFQESGSDSVAAARRGELIWYTPRRSLQEFDLQPTLEEREGDDNRQMLELYLATKGNTPDERRESWVGITQPLSRNGINLSTAQFLDIWVNDGIPYEDKADREGTLYIELGQMSEDAVWHRNNLFADPSTWTVVPPNGLLDTEDETGDDQLDLSDERDEDTGYDGVLATDPNDGFDDYRFEDTAGQDEGNYQPIQYRYVNGTEGNQELDTEDVSGDDKLDDVSAYFEIQLDLADESLWETDVRRDFVLRDPGEPLSEVPADSSGWRRIRVSLANEDLVSVKRDGSIEPIWEKIYQARIWATGFSGTRQRLQIAGIEIVGNRWLENPLTDLRDRPLEIGDIVPNEDFFVGVLNNKDDAAIYRPPFEPETRTDDNTPEREQSIALELRNFQPGHKASAYRSYPRAQDFSSLYEELEFFVNSRKVAGDADLRFSVRLSRDAASDTTNYYEFRTAVPEDWVLESVDMAELSQLQIADPDPVTGLIERDLGGGRSILRKGTPSLNEIRQISFAVENVGRTALGDGSVWVNELRLNGVKKDRGTAARAGLDIKLSDFATLNGNVERKGADFLSIGQDRGEGTTRTTSNLRGSFNIDRFLAGTGVVIPLTISQSQDRRVPKFQPNKDLILENPTSEDISESIDQNARISYSKRTSQRTWMKYLVDPFAVDTEYRRRVDVTPTRRDTTVTRSGSLRWSLGLQDAGKIKLGRGPLGLLGGGELKLLPTLLSWSYSRSITESERYARSDLSEEFTQSPSTNTRSTGLGLSARAQPIRAVTYDFNSSRNLELDEGEKKILGLGLGNETNRRQNLTANYDVPFLRQSLGPRVNWTSSSTLDFLNSGGSRENEPDRTNDLANQNSTSLSGRLDPAKLKDIFSGVPLFGSKPDSGATQRSRRGNDSSPIRIDPISVTYSFGKSSDLNRRVGSPSLLYQLGIDTAPGDGVTPLPSSTGSVNEQQSWRFDTNLKLPLGATIRTGFQATTTNGSRDGLSSQSNDRTWPDLDIGWGQIHSKLGLDRLLRLKSFSAKTSYSLTRRETQAGADASKDVTVERNLSPLLDIRATLDNGVQATLTSSSTRSQRDRLDFPATRNINLTNRASLQLKKTLNLRRKVNIPGSSQSRMVTTRMDVSAGIDWSQTKQENIVGGVSNIQGDTSRWNVNTSTNYNFTDRISGTGRIGFEQVSDNKNRANNQRAVDVQVSATFTF